MLDFILKSLMVGFGLYVLFYLVSTSYYGPSLVGQNQQQIAGINNDVYVLDNYEDDKTLRDKVEDPSNISVDVTTKTLSAISPADNDKGIALSTTSSVPEETAKVFNRDFAKYMGVSKPDVELAAIKNTTDEQGRTRIVYQQKYENIPVYGAQTSVHLNAKNEVVSYEGNTVPNIQINAEPTISKSAAETLAAMELERTKNQIFDKDKLKVSSELTILNKSLFITNGDNKSYLTWKVRINASSTTDEEYFIDAKSGDIVYSYSNIISAINRYIYDCSYDGTMCYVNTPLGSPSYTYGRSEGEAARGTTNQHNNPDNYADTDTTYDLLGITHNYYNTVLGRNGANGLGGIGDGSVDYPSDTTTAFTFVNVTDNVLKPFCPNAAYGGGRMLYCKGFSKLDVVAHEYQHAVTEYAVSGVGLTYKDESGALNEAFSDIFGLAVEFKEYAGNDTRDPSSLQWLMLEGVAASDLPPGVEIIRSLSIPSMYHYSGTLDYPDRFYSPSYYCGSQDDGGVHANLTVFGHAAYLMAMGGSFNDCTITGIGRTKMELILYRALTAHTLPSTNFNGMYIAVNDSCTELIGTGGITTDDCLQVTKALQAAEMNQPGLCEGTPRVVPLCAVPPVTSTPTPTPTPIYTATPTPTPAVYISSTVQLQYATDNSGDIQVAYVQTVGETPSKSSGTTATNGVFSMGTTIVSPGDYSFYFKPKYFLTKLKRQTIALGTNAITLTGDFTPGDFNNDDTINSIDYSLFVGNYGGTGLGDVNQDQIVNSIDFSILYNKYGYKGEYIADYPAGWLW